MCVCAFEYAHLHMYVHICTYVRSGPWRTKRNSWTIKRIKLVLCITLRQIRGKTFFYFQEEAHTYHFLEHTYEFAEKSFLNAHIQRLWQICRKSPRCDGTVLPDSAAAERHCCWTVLSDVNAVESCWPLLLNIAVKGCCWCCWGGSCWGAVFL